MTHLPTAASTQSRENVTFYVSNFSIASSLLKANTARWNRFVGAAQRINVSAIDLAAFLRREVAADDVAYLKLDVESAEWQLVPHLQTQHALCRVQYLLIEWHFKGGASGVNRSMAQHFWPSCAEGEEDEAQRGARVVEFETDSPMILI